MEYECSRQARYRLLRKIRTEVFSFIISVSLVVQREQELVVPPFLKMLLFGGVPETIFLCYRLPLIIHSILLDKYKCIATALNPTITQYTVGNGDIMQWRTACPATVPPYLSGLVIGICRHRSDAMNESFLTSILPANQRIINKRNSYWGISDDITGGWKQGYNAWHRAYWIYRPPNEPQYLAFRYVALNHILYIHAVYSGIIPDDNIDGFRIMYHKAPNIFPR